MSTESTAEVELVTPSDLEIALAGNPVAQQGWENLPPSHRREHLRVIHEAKKPETRARRIEKCVEMLIRDVERVE